MDENGYSGRLRKRRRPAGGRGDEAVSSLLELAETCGKMVIFSGSGLSANSGMSMFTTKNGLYERARQKFKIQDGIKLFSYPFYKQRRKDVQAFFAQIYGEAQSSRAAPGHVAIAQLHQMGRLQRHYTLNIDGLAQVVGMDTWHHEDNPEGITVEMHGNISYVVCPECHAVERLTGSVMNTMKASQPVICSACGKDEMRFKVMLYDDEEGDCITPEDVFERMDDDLAVAGAVLWVGISFEQSASTEYFRKVRHMLASHGRLEQVTQVIINPSDEAYFNVMSTMSNKEDVKVLDVRAVSDDALPRMVQHLHKLQGTKPDPASVKAAAEAATAAAAAAAKRKRQQLEEAAAAAAAIEQKEQVVAVAAACTDSKKQSSSGGDGSRQADEAMAITVTAAMPASAASPQELATMDSAAAAALALPAAVQKHFLQQQQHLAATGLQHSAPCMVSSPLAAAARQADSIPGLSAATAASAAIPQTAAPVAPIAASSGAVQQALGLGTAWQQLLGQFQAVHALQAAASAPAVQQPAVVAATASAAAQPASAALVKSELPAVPQLDTRLPVVPDRPANPLAAAAAMLAGSPAVASLLLSSPGLIAALAAAAANNNVQCTAALPALGQGQGIVAAGDAGNQAAGDSKLPAAAEAGQPAALRTARAANDSSPAGVQDVKQLLHAARQSCQMESVHGTNGHAAAAAGVKHEVLDRQQPASRVHDDDTNS